VGRYADWTGYCSGKVYRLDWLLQWEGIQIGLAAAVGRYTDWTGYCSGKVYRLDWLLQWEGIQIRLAAAVGRYTYWTGCCPIRGSNSNRGKKIFSFFTKVYTRSRSTQPHFHWIQGGNFLRGKSAAASDSALISM
jgi:hypothetical protein